jgi:hypothetical protein
MGWASAPALLPGIFMHPHRSTDDRGSAEHLVGNQGRFDTHAGKSTAGHANCPCGGSLAPRVARVWLRLLRGSAYPKSRILEISLILGWQKIQYTQPLPVLPVSQAAEPAAAFPPVADRKSQIGFC